MGCTAAGDHRRRRPLPVHRPHNGANRVWALRRGRSARTLAREGKERGREAGRARAAAHGPQAVGRLERNFSSGAGEPPGGGEQRAARDIGTGATRVRAALSTPAASQRARSIPGRRCARESRLGFRSVAGRAVAHGGTASRAGRAPARPSRRGGGGTRMEGCRGTVAARVRTAGASDPERLALASVSERADDAPPSLPEARNERRGVHVRAGASSLPPSLCV